MNPVLRRCMLFRERYNVIQYWARDGSQARQRGLSQSLLGPQQRRYNPRLVKDVSVHEAECRRELEQAQVSQGCVIMHIIWVKGVFLVLVKVCHRAHALGQGCATGCSLLQLWGADCVQH